MKFEMKDYIFQYICVIVLCLTFCKLILLGYLWTLITCSALALSFFLISIFLYDEWKYGVLKSIPGPKGIPLIGTLTLRKDNKGSYESLLEYVWIYGGIVHLKMNPLMHILLVTDQKLANTLLHSPKCTNKSNLYQLFRDLHGDGILLSSGKQIRDIKKFMEPIFYKNYLQLLVKAFNFHCNRLVRILEKHIDNGPVDILLYGKCLALDITHEIMFHLRSDSFDNSNNEVFKAADTFNDITEQRTLHVLKYLKLTFQFTSDYKRYKDSLQVLYKFAEKVVKDFEGKQGKCDGSESCKFNANMDTPKSVLQLLYEFPVFKNNLTEELKRFCVLEIFIGNYETLNVTINALLFELAKHQDVQAKIVDELHQIFGNDIYEPVSYENLKEMKYTEAVIKESLRLHGPGNYIGRELTEDLVYDGIVLPKGLQIVFLLKAMHDNDKIFEKPHLFLPDRFISQTYEPCSYIPFSAGLRKCPGQRIAMLELKVIVANLLRHYEFSCAYPNQELTTANTFIMTITGGLPLQIKRRHF